MEKSFSNNWFMKEEFKARSVAGGFSTFASTFLILVGTMFVFTIHPSRHIFILYDFITLFSLKNLGILFMIMLLSSLLVCLHYQYHEIAPISPVNRFQFCGKMLKPTNLVHTLVSGGLFFMISHLFTYLVPGRYTGAYHQCSNEAEKVEFCINEFWFIFVFFGFVVGVTNSIVSIASGKNLLSFLDVQRARFLVIKCKFLCILSDSSHRSWKYFQNFAIVYYVFGFIARDFVAAFFAVDVEVTFLLSIWTIYDLIPIAWNLWLLGTFLLLTWEISWQWFEVYNTQNYSFPLDSVFPEDEPKLLLANLSESRPQAVQHLAFQCLSLLVKGNPAKRQQIFQLSHKTENGRPVLWNKVLDNCLPRIQCFTHNIVKYQSNSLMQDKRQIAGKTSSTSSEGSNESSKLASPASVSVYKRRDLNNTTYQPDATNISCLNVSSLNDTYTHSSSRSHNASIAVPTPRLWTASNNIPKDDTVVYSGNGNVLSNGFEVSFWDKRLGYFKQNLRALPIMQYFIKPISAWELQNLYHQHFIYKSAMQILSYLCAASVTEDKFGTVQGCLHEIITSLNDLLSALEKINKVSPSSTNVYKLHAGLKNEVKASLHRIADAYGESLKSVNIFHEHRRRLEGFCSYSE